MWLNKLQIAIIEKDTDKIDELTKELPEFENKEQMQKASYLLKEAATLLFELKDETSHAMRQIKKNIDFINSTQNKPKNKLDVKY
jgi:hypothetical protein